jgi:lipopolysaccharide export system protein LptC
MKPLRPPAAPPRAERPGRAGRLKGLSARVEAGAAGRIGHYSAFVGIMRYALPSVALILLSMVVIWPLLSGREEGFHLSYASKEVEDGALRMIKARYVGTSSSNQPFTVTAAEAVQPESGSDVVLLKDLMADLFGEGERWYAIRAREGLFQRPQQLLDLAGDVTLFSDQGHEMHTETAHVDLKNGIAEGDQPISGQGPFGLLSAVGFRAVQADNTIFFKQRVKLTLFPSRPAAGSAPP